MNEWMRSCSGSRWVREPISAVIEQDAEIDPGQPAGNNVTDSRNLKTNDRVFWRAADVCILSLPASLNKSEMSWLQYISDLLWKQSMTQLKPSFIYEYWLSTCGRPTQTEPPSLQMLVVKWKMSGNCDGSDWTGIFIQFCCSQFNW